MRRLFTLGVLVLLMLALVPVQGSAQPVPALPLTLNTVDGNVSVMGGTVINLATLPGNGIYEYGTSDCSGDVAVVHGNTATVAKAGGTSVGFAPFQAGNVGTCRVGTWTLRPTLTLNGVADNVTVNAGEAIIFVTDPAVTIYRYATTDCSGSTTTNYPSSTAVVEPSGVAFSVLAVWSDVAVRSDCFIATWLEPAPTVAPPLTINGVADNVTLTTGDPAYYLTDAAATIALFEGATCSGAPFVTVPFETSSMPPIATTFSAQAYWTAYPDIIGGCLSVTWLDPAPVAPPPLTVNGVAANATLTVGDVALFETETDASISFFLTADCGGAVASEWTPSFTITPIEPITYSVRAFWTATPTVESACLNATWTAAIIPSPTPAEPISPTEAPASTATATGTETPAPTATATATATVTETPTPGETATTTEPAVPTHPVIQTPQPLNQSLQGSTDIAIVTGLPDTGAGSGERAMIGFTTLMLVIVLATGIGYRSRQH